MSGWQVALHQWLHQNMEAVVSMFEDQFDLCTLQTEIVEESNGSETETFGWWKKLSIRTSGPISSSLRFAVINQITVPVKRTAELRALTGWYVLSVYHFSLFSINYCSSFCDCTNGYLFSLTCCIPFLSSYFCWNFGVSIRNYCSDWFVHPIYFGQIHKVELEVPIWLNYMNRASDSCKFFEVL